MKKIVIFTAASLGLAMFLTAGNASAQVMTGTATVNSSEFGFNPAKLIDAIDGSNGSEACFICRNTNKAGGTTAGALTNSMFGELRPNSDADLGDQTFNPSKQDMEVPSAHGCGDSDCNDAGSFTFSLPLMSMDFSEDPGVSLGATGVKMTFSNTFQYNANDDGTPAGSTFDQKLSQTTFSGGFDGSEEQFVQFDVDGDAPGNNTGAGSESTVNWTQTIKDGGFELGPLSGSFTYESGRGDVDRASAPTGAGQSGDTTDRQAIF